MFMPKLFERLTPPQLAFDRGQCPVCEQAGEYLPVRGQHWFACHADGVCWCIDGAPVLPPADATHAHRNWRRMLGYAVAAMPKCANELEPRPFFEEVVPPPPRDLSPWSRFGWSTSQLHAALPAERFGVCPECDTASGYVNIGAGHWFLCRTHKLVWYVGEGKLNTFLDEHSGIWAANHAALSGFRVVTDDGGLTISGRARPGPYFEHVAPVSETLLDPRYAEPVLPATSEVWSALDRVLAYTWEDERRHYEADPDPGHIFCDLWRLRHTFRRLRSA